MIKTFIIIIIALFLLNNNVFIVTTGFLLVPITKKSDNTIKSFLLLVTTSNTRNSNNYNIDHDRNSNTDSKLLSSVSSRTVEKSYSDDDNDRKIGNNGVCILESNVYRNVSIQLAKNLSLPLKNNSNLKNGNNNNNNNFSFALVVESYIDYHSSQLQQLQQQQHYIGIVGLVQDDNNKKKKRDIKFITKPLYIDFYPPINSRLGQRVVSSSNNNDLLIQAVKPKDDCKLIYDLTAGFGQDSLLLARSGGGQCHVHMIERDPIIAVLLQDGIRRLNDIADNNDNNNNFSLSRQELIMAQNLAKCLSFEQGDGIDVLTNLQQQQQQQQLPDVIYLDPMFPVRKKKSSAVKKNMQILHGLLQSQSINNEESRLQEEKILFQKAYKVALKRVVVKRPIHALPLIDYIKPTYVIKGSINRWDVYIVNK